MPYDTSSSLEDKITSLFQPDVLISAQYYDPMRRKVKIEPEKGLVLAVLEDAIVCFQRHLFARDRKGKALFSDTEEWILEERGDRLFSFENVCEVLEFNPEYIRQGLMRWKDKKVAQRSKAKIYRLPLRPKVNEAGLERPRCAGEKVQREAGR